MLDFVLLDCDTTGQNLVKSANQMLNGESIVNQKEGLYLCEKFDIVSD